MSWRDFIALQSNFSVLFNHFEIVFWVFTFYNTRNTCDFPERHYSITLLYFATQGAKHFVDIEPHTDYLKDSLRRCERILV